MALIELYLYPFKGQKGNAIAMIKLYRQLNGCGLAEAKAALDTIYFYKNTLPYEPKHTPKTELLFYSGNDVRLCLEVRDKLEKEVGKTEILYNGNIKTLELLYGK